MEQAFQVTVSRGEILCDSEFGDPATSSHVLPYPTGAEYQLIQSYCPSNPTWGHHDWFAYDFDMANGSSVVASRGGTVLAVQNDRPNVGGVCGQNAENFVFIRHEDGTVTQYMHLFPLSILVATGDIVESGQPIGLSGNSGCSAGPHLHVATFRDATNFDRQSTIPINYSNTTGPVDAQGGLVQSQVYTASPPS